ncbi:hypothetical protein JCM3775_003689 [Rhodotorula graminis]|uniref:Zn(2)-C6 fungal-type domain-containing protein n=1 Tax=Rhodotorula graminis (strain WP1) TaxID=578459 RepID=A0A194S9Q4_RHOGW|nr:uncharacterized protein RHOBADRAFT_51197 [Rhodotorula graminis WP1]KPV77319.1 hypothetical protein RHOBADRAFT_51197 [Rhodotorula graminis WP1]
MASDDGSNSTGKTRSKAGCLTCRQRRKKCDETHSKEHGGACQRCISGAWRCEWPAPPSAAPVRVFQRGAKVRAKQERLASLAVDGSVPPPGPVASTSTSASAPILAGPPQLDPLSSILPPSTHAPAPASTSILPPTLSFPHLAPPTSAADVARPLSTHLAPPSAAHVPPGVMSHHLAISPFFQSGASATLSLPAFLPADEPGPERLEPDAFWQSVDSQFGVQFSAPPVPVPSTSFPPVSSGQEDTLDPAYDAFFVAHLCALDKPLRDAVISQIRSTIASSELCKHAALATTMLLRLHVLRDAPKEAGTPSVPGADEYEVQRLRAKADEYYRRGLEHLSHQSIPITAKMLALFDLWLHQFITVGAEAASFLLLLGDVFALELGPRPSIQHSPINTPEQVIIAISAWEDCIRCATSPRRRPFFSFADLPGDPLSPSSSALRDSVNDVRSDIPALGYMPVGLLLCIAAIANLSVDMEALPDVVVKAKASAIERAVRGWRPLPPVAGLDSAAFVEQVSTSEMWRHAIIIYLYQVGHRHGPMSAVLCAAVQQILKIGSPLLARFEPGRISDLATLSPSPSTSSTSSPTSLVDPSTSEACIASAAIALFAPMARAVPFFLAGTCAMTPVERRTCIAGLRACGEDRGYHDDMLALERIWERQRSDGWPKPWREVLDEEKLHVVFL